MTAPIRMAAVGLDHRHIYGMAGHMIDAGATLVGWWTDGEPATLPGWRKRFPGAPRVADRRRLIEDPAVDLVLIAAVPADRAALALEAMAAGKDVMVDKPGCTTLEQLAAIQAAAAETGRIWSVNFSEQFEVPSVTRASELVRAGAVGRVLQTVGLGPHRHNAASRPDWFYDPARYGGILCDIGSHQIAQFLHFTGSESATVEHAFAGNLANPATPGLQDFGEVVLSSTQGRGYVRLDWFTPDALPTWGDGRLTVLGTEGYIELRKYVDPGRGGATDTLILVNGERCEAVDASGAGLPYFPALIADIGDRSWTAAPLAWTVEATRLAIEAQMIADGRA